MGKTIFFFSPIFIRVNLGTYICPKRNSNYFWYWHWSHSKCRDILQTLNVYKIPGKEHQIVHDWDVHEISAL